MAASAAMLWERVDDVVVDSPVLPAQRDVLRSLPGGGQPGDGGLDDALRLGRGMRLRLLAAVRALLADESLAGLGDAARLTTVVLFAKSRAPEGRKDDLQSYIWGAELGRWLGMTASTVHHDVLPVLRQRDALHTRMVVNDEGHPVGLDCLVMPLWRAHQGGGAAHPLALNKAELAVLLRLIEALFGPGWAPEDKEPTPPGLLAGRTGKGAATDRLGLLLMVLNTRASGWLQLCGGSVRKKEGRGAATLSRLLGCSPSGARKVLARLTEAGVVARQRKATVTRMNGRGRVMLLPVARAYGRVLAPVEPVSGSGSVFSQRPDGAVGDLAPGQDAGGLGTSGFCGAEAAVEAGDRERPDGAEFHADHASVVTPVSPPPLSGGFSGEGRGGEGRRPEHVCVREDQAVGGEDAAAEPASPVAEVGPLRGEKPGKSAVDEQGGQRAAGTKAGGRLEAVAGEKTRQQGRADLPEDLDLRVALGPVAWLWAGLNRWQQDQVVKAVNAELERLKDLLMQPEGAPRLLADRLTDRLEETGGEARVSSPFGWITRRGLVQRPACSDVRCDDGIRLDTGGDCANCGNVIHIRRARRVRIAADIDRELPGLGVAERRQVLEERLREYAAAEAEDFVWRREQARAEQARREKARAAARERGERERREAAAADAVRQALACEDCGQQRSAGLCEACRYRRRTEAAIAEAGLVAATWAADLDDAADVAAVAAHVRATLEADIETTHQQFLQLMEPGELEANPSAAASVLAFNALQAVQQALPEYRSSALGRLGSTLEADAEARRAYKTEQNRRWFRANPNGADAVAAATKAADAARERTAEYLLATRLEQLRKRTAARTETVAPAPWSARLTELAARPLDGDQAGAAIA
ncbi:hypothetical protein ACFY30_34070 [Streptomyces sp. NPDC000345]|uniref:hypothetical protein n=1 Tax=Streptomyces sp. NPDC000345 TaxID=3364537 RepID=UPI0036A9E692